VFRHRFPFILAVVVLLLAATYVSAKPVEKTFPGRRGATSFSAGDGKLCLYNYHEDFAVETRYRKGDRYRQKGLGEIRRVFRSRSDGREHTIDIELIELIDHLQDHFAIDCVELISGYRSPKFNRKLKKTRVNVAEESLHMEGRAADIHLDEVTEEILSRYVRSLGVGGVGYYPAFDFVHVDTGDVRRWDLPDRQGRLLMAMRNGSKWRVMTDRNVYLSGEVIEIEVMNIAQTQHPLNITLRVEHFNRGEWKLAENLPIPKGVKLAPGKVWRTKWRCEAGTVYGKFRLMLPGQSNSSQLSVLSNEFYRKRQ
jgi:uncharacterized protein YcbK (DUF882 family)